MQDISWLQSFAGSLDKPFQIARHRRGVAFRNDPRGVRIPGLDHDVVRPGADSIGEGLRVLFCGCDPCTIVLDPAGGVKHYSVTDVVVFEHADEGRYLTAPVPAPLHVETY